MLSSHLVCRLSPSYLIFLLCALQISIWTSVPTLINYAPPLDVVEGYIWGREWVIGTYKHPALPSWILEVTRLLTGHVGWPAYAAAQICIVATLLFVYALGRELVGPRQAAIATFLQFGIYYFSWPSIELNHNIMLMPVFAGFAWALWVSVERDLTWLWLVLGSIATIGLYTKLSMVIPLAIGGMWVLLDAKARSRLRGLGPWLALSLTALLTLPLLFWLFKTNFEVVQYAKQRAKARSVGIVGFLAAHVGMCMMLAVSCNWSRHFSEPDQDKADSRRPTFFVTLMWVGSLVALFGSAALLDSRMRAAWAAPVSSFSGLMAVVLIGRRFTHAAYQRTAIGAVIALIISPTLFVADSLWNSRKPAEGLQVYRSQRTNWPQLEISESLEARWVAATGRPLRIVVGEMWVAGLVALTARSQPSVMEVVPSRSPWVTPEHLREFGALVVWSEPGGMNPNDLIQTFLPNTKPEYVQFKLPRHPSAEPITIGYGIIPPSR